MDMMIVKWKTSKKRIKIVKEISDFWKDNQNVYRGPNSVQKVTDFALRKMLDFLKMKHEEYQHNLLYSTFYTLYVLKFINCSR